MEQEQSRETVLDKLLKSYSRYYNVTLSEPDQRPLVARCDYFEHSEKYVISRKANLWSADGEEFLYLFDVPHLTQDIYKACEKTAYEDGMTRINVGPGHMYSYISAVIICDTCDPEAAAAVKKARIHKSFHFSLHGWMDFHAAAVITENRRIESNAAGRNAAKILKKVLYSTKAKKGEN